MSEIGICVMCWRGLHGACNALYFEDSCSCTHKPTEADKAAAVGSFKSMIGESILNLETEEPDTRIVKRRNKDDQAVTDPQSTGRKRAAKLYPLKDENGIPLPCDLANKRAPTLPKYYKVQIDGCGVRPGSLPANAQARHHNDFNTLNNERSNIGLLCHACHNLLHARNDPFKDEIYETIYGFRPSMEDLSHAAKVLKSGIVSGGQVADKHPTEG